MTQYVVTDDGQWVNGDFERLARMVQDYDQSLQLVWIPPAARTRDDKEPYAIQDTRDMKIVFFIKETDTPVEVIERLFTGDNKHGDVLKRLEAREDAARVWKMKQDEDSMQEAAELAFFIKQSPLHTIRLNGKKFDHNRRRIG